jgi:hypothetical protein
MFVVAFEAWVQIFRTRFPQRFGSLPEEARANWHSMEALRILLIEDEERVERLVRPGLRARRIHTPVPVLMALDATDERFSGLVVVSG